MLRLERHWDDHVLSFLTSQYTLLLPRSSFGGRLDSASTRKDALILYDALSGVDSTYIEIGGGTHFLKFGSNRDMLYQTVRTF